MRKGITFRKNLFEYNVLKFNFAFTANMEYCRLYISTVLNNSGDIDSELAVSIPEVNYFFVTFINDSTT